MMGTLALGCALVFGLFVLGAVFDALAELTPLEFLGCAAVVALVLYLV